MLCIRYVMLCMFCNFSWCYSTPVLTLTILCYVLYFTLEGIDHTAASYLGNVCKLARQHFGNQSINLVGFGCCLATLANEPLRFASLRIRGIKLLCFLGFFVY